MHDIGARIRELRGRILTQQQLADAAGVSVALIRKLEQGSRSHASIGKLALIASALDVELGELLGERTAVPSVDPQEGVVALRRALTPADALLDELDDDASASLDEAQKAVDYAWGAYWGGRYDHLATILPQSLTQTRATVHAASVDDKASAYDLLTRIYWVAGCTLVHLGHTDLAWQAIGLSTQAAQSSNDELLAATVTGSVAWQLLVQGRYDESHRIAMKTAASIEPHGDVAPQHLSAYGSLVLQGATAAGRGFRVSEALHLVDESREVSDRMGEDRRDYETAFGPSQVAMQSVDVRVVTEDYTAAMDAAKAMPNSGQALPLASRCRHLTDRSLALARLGRPDEALAGLLTAESMGKDWIKHQTLPRRIVGELLERDRQSRLRGLARRLNVTGS